MQGQQLHRLRPGSLRQRQAVHADVCKGAAGQVHPERLCGGRAGAAARWATPLVCLHFLSVVVALALALALDLWPLVRVRFREMNPPAAAGAYACACEKSKCVSQDTEQASWKSCGRNLVQRSLEASATIISAESPADIEARTESHDELLVGPAARWGSLDSQVSSGEVNLGQDWVRVASSYQRLEQFVATASNPVVVVPVMA